MEAMVGFGRKQGWLAIRDADRERVAATLGLRDLGTVSWRSGVDLAYLTDDRLLLTPPLPGARDAMWLLVAGRWLLGAGFTVDIVELSTRLSTEVQLFSTYRVNEIHRWERAVNGNLVRAFGYIGQTGEVTSWRGDPDGVEAAIGLPATPEEDVLVSEADVLRVAEAWSVDPAALDGLPAPGPLRVAATTQPR
jgi:hypothetical protein